VNSFLWHLECPSFGEALEKGYLIKGSKGRTGITKWWQGDNAGVVDFTNEKAVEWWQSRLRQLQRKYGINSFKFDAGETSYLPVSPKLQNGEPNTSPNLYTTKYVEAVATFGGLVEVRSGRKNQVNEVSNKC